MGVVSAIPATIDKVVSVLTSALPSVTVLDGPLPGSASEGNYLAVGAADMLPDAASTEAVNGSQRWRTTGYTREERFVVMCVARSWNGDGNQKAARDYTFTTMAAVEAQLRADPSWGGVVLDSDGITGTALRQGNTSGGTFAELTFDLSFRALI